MQSTSAKQAEKTASRPISVSKVLILGVLGLLLYFAHGAFVPLALALLLSLILSGPVETLHKKGVPRSVSAAMILVLVVGAIAGVGILMWTPAQGWFAKAPQTMAAIRRKVTPIEKVVDHVDDLRKDAGGVGAQGRPAPPETPATSQSLATVIMDAGAAALASALCFLIVSLFLLTGGPPMMARMAAAFADGFSASHVLNVIEKVRAEVGHFYVTTTFINLGLGTATGLAMWAWGMPTPYLWGALAAIVNYIPYAGAVTTLAVITLVAMMSFNHLSHVLGVAGTYVVLATLEGQVAQPLLVGRRMEVNPLLIFLGLWFGGLFWGIAGIILATPTLVALKVIAENTKHGGPMLEFLGPNDQSPHRDDTLKSLAGAAE